MPVSLLRRLCAGRMLYTGEHHGRALGELRRQQAGSPPIPDAAGDGQPILEALFLEVLGRCSKDRWQPYMLPFAVRSVTPRPHELIVRVPKQYLPDILREALPAWPAGEEDGAGEPGCQVYGIPGLRARLSRGQVILARPGLPGRIIIPAPADRARKAALIAADTHRGEADVCLPWLTHPRDWHPAEESFARASPQHYGTRAEHGRTSLLASQVLRRLPGLCPAPRAYYHDMWFNRFGDTTSIQFEWAFGTTPAVLLDRLLHPVLGPGAQIALSDGQALADCYAPGCCRVRVQSTGNPATWIDLRRATWDEDTHDSTLAQQFGERRRCLRQAAEQQHGY
jgi:hypothetical protein